MQKEYTEKLSDLYQAINKPLADITELNIKTFNRLTKENETLDDLFKAKKPEDLVAAQLKLLNTAGLETIRYAQQVYTIMQEAVAHNTKIMTDTVKETTKHAHSTTKTHE